MQAPEPQTAAPGVRTAVLASRRPSAPAWLPSLGRSRGLGRGAFLQSSTTAFITLKIAGGLHLGLIGLRPTPTNDEATPAPAPKTGPALRAGLFSCALNPKVGSFFLGVVPQFLPAHAVAFHTIMILGLIDAVVAIIWLAVVAVGAARAVLWLRKPKVTRTLDLSSSLALTALGLLTLVTAL